MRASSRRRIRRPCETLGCSPVVGNDAPGTVIPRHPGRSTSKSGRTSVAAAATLCQRSQRREEEPMTRLLTRRRLLGAGGVAALLPLGSRARPAAAQTVSGQLVPLDPPRRLFDSRVRSTNLLLSGRKIEHDQTFTIYPRFYPSDLPPTSAIFVNCTITETEGSGYLVPVRLLCSRRTRRVRHGRAVGLTKNIRKNDDT